MVIVLMSVKFIDFRNRLFWVFFTGRRIKGSKQKAVEVGRISFSRVFPGRRALGCAGYCVTLELHSV